MWCSRWCFWGLWRAPRGPARRCAPRSSLGGHVRASASLPGEIRRAKRPHAPPRSRDSLGPHLAARRVKHSASTRDAGTYDCLRSPQLRLATTGGRRLNRRLAPLSGRHLHGKQTRRDGRSAANDPSSGSRGALPLQRSEHDLDDHALSRIKCTMPESSRAGDGHVRTLPATHRNRDDASHRHARSEIFCPEANVETGAAVACSDLI